ncbi:phosphodiester glycosidase family protein [Rivularia sp. UHCC 0363]|uniref:phosphodiester glycosidase family protein n=1 Tax=Rivularia sp. UHCC 0363 TaxID=3110244 RepID=UPI002B204D16|nr:phosphodiester glycosidase family protein [Rivularia sp. UHCC 0363]MEA5595016.1 phosphodiester glycosidase family protein [Rivularia sp. UHCC 0363]
MSNYRKYIYATGTGFLLLLPLIFYSWWCFSRPSQTNSEQQLFKGIAYKRDYDSTIRPTIIHTVTIDLSTPGIKVLVTPPQNIGKNSITSRSTSQFLQEFQLQLAINANYFHPFRENTFWDYYPHSGDTTSAIGQAISNGKHYASSDRNWGVLCISLNNRAQILANGNCPINTLQGVAGKDILIVDGKVVNPKLDEDQPYPRVAVATNKAGNMLWLIAVDGKQPLYSEGVTVAELTRIASKLGAYTALSLDGGGSTTLVVAKNNQPKLLNAPIHTKLPMRERPIANHLGFYADKL